MKYPIRIAQTTEEAITVIMFMRAWRAARSTRHAPCPERAQTSKR